MCGGCKWGFGSSGSRPAIRSKTARTSNFIGCSSDIPRGRRPPRCAANNGRLIASVRRTTRRPRLAAGGGGGRRFFSPPPPRPPPPQLARPSYPLHWEVRAVDLIGQVSWHNRPLFLSTALYRHQVAFEEVAEAQWRVWFGRVPLGLFDERRRRWIVEGNAPAQ